MIRVVLIDDEPHAINTLRWEIEQNCPDLKIMDSFTNPEEALIALPQLKPDLVFLDIEMPILNGFDLLDQLETLSFALIFVTAYDQYAVQAFRINAIDYLLKPVDSENLIEAVKRVKIQRFQGEEHTQTNRAKIEQLRKSFNKVAIPQLDRMEFVLPDEIIYCKSEGSYTDVIFSKRKVLITKALKEMENRLEEHGFYRVHKSYLVNLHHIQQYVRGDGGYLVMDNGDQVPVARRKKEDLMRLF